jgi:hypothetical protein
MATSGSTNFAMTSRDVVKHALRLISVLDGAEEPGATDAQFGLTTLELLLKSWGANPRLWLKTEASLALVAATASYTLALARRVYSVRRRTSNIDLALQEFSREDYFDTPSKAQAGTPIAWYFDPQRATKKLYVWPVPTAAVAASTTLEYTYGRVIEDCDSLNNNPDVPQEWLDALTYGLAVRLGPPFGVAGSAEYREVKEEAGRLFAFITADDQETASVFMQPA